MRLAPAAARQQIRCCCPAAALARWRRCEKQLQAAQALLSSVAESVGAPPVAKLQLGPAQAALRRAISAAAAFGNVVELYSRYGEQDSECVSKATLVWGAAFWLLSASGVVRLAELIPTYGSPDGS